MPQCMRCMGEGISRSDGYVCGNCGRSWENAQSTKFDIDDDDNDDVCYVCEEEGEQKGNRYYCSDCNRSWPA